MTTRLQVVFSGPCVHVPSADGKQLRVLIVDGREPDVERETLIHVPVLLLDKQNLANTSPGLEVIPFQPDPDEPELQRCAIFLSRQQIAVETDLDPRPLSFLTLPNEPLAPLEAGERGSFDLLPRLDDARPGAGRIDRGALLATVPPDGVAARALFASGEAFTAELSSFAGQLRRWVFHDPQSPELVSPEAQGRLLGLDLGMELAFERRALVVLQDFDTGRRRSLEIVAGESETVRVEVANREPLLIFSRDPRARARLEGIGPNNVDRDFALLYRLSANHSAIEATRPVPHLVNPDGSQERAGTTCGSAVGT